MASAESMAPSLTQLFFSFTRVGGVMFGGGYAMLPLLEREVVHRRRWCTLEEMADIYAVSQVIPGVIAVNTAMILGHRYRGWRGAAASAGGAVIAPFGAILLIAVAFARVAAHPAAGAFLAGLRPAVAGLLLATAHGLVGRTWRGRWRAAAGMAASVLLFSGRLHPAALIAAAVAGGLLLRRLRQRKEARP